MNSNAWDLPFFQHVLRAQKAPAMLLALKKDG